MSKLQEYPPMPKRGYPNEVKSSCFYEEIGDVCGCCWMLPVHYAELEHGSKCGNPEHCTGKRPADRYEIRSGQLVEIQKESACTKIEKRIEEMFKTGIVLNTICQEHCSDRCKIYKTCQKSFKKSVIKLTGQLTLEMFA